MGTRGPKKTPTATLVSRGSRRGKDRAKAGTEPTLSIAAPPCPEWLRPKARTYWQDITNIGLAMSVITNSDRIAMAMLCDAIADWVEYSKELDKPGAGPTAQSGKGSLYQHPLVGAKNKAWQRVAKMLACFGMTPADRANVKANGDKKSNPLQDILEKRKGRA